jgi:hypothetical protein
LHDFLLAAKRSQREAAAQHLTQGRHVRFYAEILLGATQRKTEPSDDFIKNQHSPILGGEFS